jgi:transcriptional regulator with XRE-family HTH domain
MAIYYSISNVGNDINYDIKPLFLEALPEDIRRALKRAREKRGWSQRKLASRVGLTQKHISSIESGKIVPRYDTLLELVRILDWDLMMVPRALVPAVQSMIRDHLRPDAAGESEERPLYTTAGDEPESPDRHEDEL